MSAEERRGQILEAALDVFAAKGFSGARTKEIAERAGISETLIFRHFKSKEELYASSLAHLYAGHPLHEDMRGPMDKEDDQDLLRSIALHMLEHTRRDPRIVRLRLFQVLDERSGPPAQHHKEDDSDSMLADYIRRRVDEGGFAPCDARFMAKLFHYTVFMAVADRQLGLLDRPVDMGDEDMAETLARCFLSGLLAR